MPEDRHRMGLVLPFEAYESEILGYQREPKYNKGLSQDHNAMLTTYTEQAEKFDIRPVIPILNPPHSQVVINRKLLFHAKSMPRLKCF